MKFHVTRTSNYSDNIKPCEKAKEIITEIRSVNTTTARKIWYIEVNSIEDLLSFIDEQESEVVINTQKTDIVDYGMPSIEIYDDYRE